MLFLFIVVVNRCSSESPEFLWVGGLRCVCVKVIFMSNLTTVELEIMSWLRLCYQKVSNGDLLVNCKKMYGFNFS